MKLLLVGDSGEIAVGSHFFKAAEQLSLSPTFVAMQDAYRGPYLLAKLFWLWDKRPYRLQTFSRTVVKLCEKEKPDLLLATGVSPIRRKDLERIRSLGIKTANFLTDDPFNPAHRNRWFVKALPGYDFIFSPRRANEADLRAAGCRMIYYLPFAYQPDLHFPETATDREQADLVCDIFFAGGGDPDRRTVFERLVQENFDVQLYGFYWHSPLLHPRYKGYADPSKLRKLTQAAKVSLTLVRKANRDGHSMRTFELAAQGGCLLLEDTDEHREIFKDISSVVPFFKTPDELVRQTKFLLENPERRSHIRKTILDWVHRNPHTYVDRLREVLEVTGFSEARGKRVSHL